MMPHLLLYGAVDQRLLYILEHGGVRADIWTQHVATHWLGGAMDTPEPWTCVSYMRVIKISVSVLIWWLNLTESQQRKTGLSWGAITWQATLLESGPDQGPQNDSIEMSPGALWGTWLTPLGGWGVEIKECPKGERWEPGSTRMLVLRPCPDKTATPVVPRYPKGTWKCWESYSKMWETLRYGTWDRQARVQRLYWCSGWLATSVNSWKSCGETWDIGHASKMSNTQPPGGGVWFEPKHSGSSTCGLCSENI